MKSTSASKVARAAKAIAGIQELAAALPTEAERSEVVNSLDALITFLTQIKSDLCRIPVTEDVDSLTSSLAKLESFISRAESNPILARAIGLERSKPRQTSVPRAADPLRIQSISAELANLTIDQTRERLTAEDAYGLADLRALAQSLGVTIQRRMTRQALANQIVTKLANTKGYMALSKTSGTDTERG